MTLLHLIDYILIVRASLIICYPTTIGKLEAALFHELLYLLLDSFCLSGIPHGEELHLNVCECGVGLSCHLVDDRVQDQVNSGMLSVLKGTTVILVNCLQPTDIVMSMWHHMNIKLFVLICSIMLHKFLRIFTIFFLLCYFFEPFVLLIICGLSGRLHHALIFRVILMHRVVNIVLFYCLGFVQKD